MYSCFQAAVLCNWVRPSAVGRAPVPPGPVNATVRIDAAAPLATVDDKYCGSWVPGPRCNRTRRVITSIQPLRTVEIIYNRSKCTRRCSITPNDHPRTQSTCDGVYHHLMRPQSLVLSQSIELYPLAVQQGRCQKQIRFEIMTTVPPTPLVSLLCIVSSYLLGCPTEHMEVSTTYFHPIN